MPADTSILDVLLESERKRLADRAWESEKMARLGLKVDFNQGLDARLVDDVGEE